MVLNIFAMVQHDIQIKTTNVDLKTHIIMQVLSAHLKQQKSEL